MQTSASRGWFSVFELVFGVGGSGLRGLGFQGFRFQGFRV